MKVSVIIRKLVLLIIFGTFFYPNHSQSQQKEKRAKHLANVARRKRNKVNTQARTQLSQQKSKKRQISQRPSSGRQVQPVVVAPRRTVAPQQQPISRPQQQIRRLEEVRGLKDINIVKAVNRPKVSTSSGEGQVTTFTRQVIEEKDKIIIKIQFGKEIDDSLFKERNIKMKPLFDDFGQFEEYSTSNYSDRDLGWRVRISIKGFPVNVRTTSLDSRISLNLYGQKELSLYGQKEFGEFWDAEQCFFNLKTYRNVDLSQTSASFSKKDRCFTIIIPYAK